MRVAGVSSCEGGVDPSELLETLTVRNGRWTYGGSGTLGRCTLIVSSGIGNIVLDYLIDIGKFQAELALRADCEDLAEKVFARCEALVETLTLELEYQKEPDGA